MILKKINDDIFLVQVALIICALAICSVDYSRTRKQGRAANIEITQFEHEIGLNCQFRYSLAHNRNALQVGVL